VFLGFYPGRTGSNFPYEQKTKLVPITEPARLPGSYEEAPRYMNPNKLANSEVVCEQALIVGGTSKAVDERSEQVRGLTGVGERSMRAWSQGYE